MDKKKKRAILIYAHDTGELIEIVCESTGKSSRQVETIIAGGSRNMGEGYDIREFWVEGEELVIEETSVYDLEEVEKEDLPEWLK